MDFACGSWPNVKIFQAKLANVLSKGSRVVTDRVFEHLKCITPHNVKSRKKELHTRVRARHEACNAQLKHFIVLKFDFCHNVELHGQVFHAVTKSVMLTIRYEKPLFTL